MLKIKDNISLKELEEFGFENPSSTQRLWKYTFWDGGVVRIWIDRYRFLHYNAINIKVIDTIYKMHNILELVDGKEDLRRLSTPKLLEENKRLKEDLKDACYVIEKIKKEKQQAIEYIKNEDIDICTIRNNDIVDTKNELLEKLGYKEIEEMPMFKGTMEELDNLTLGGKNNG